MATHYGRWRVDTPLSEGGQAHVFRVIDSTGGLKGAYALKRLKNTKNELRQDRFKREIRALNNLNHPNIITIIDSDVDTSSQHRWFVMPIAAGGSLENRKSVAVGDVIRTLSMSLQVAEALRAAHNLGFIHRDVKPANILFPRDGDNLWLADFGLCHELGGERLTEEGEAVGPRFFMAPEMERGGQIEVTVQVDIYSLGELVYYLLSGGVYLHRESILDPEFQERLPQGVPGDHVRALLRAMIATNPNERFRDMDAVCSRITLMQSELSQAKEGLLPAHVVNRVSQMSQRAERRAEEARIVLQKKREAEALALSVAQRILGEVQKQLETLARSFSFEGYRIQVGQGTSYLYHGFAEGTMPNHRMYRPFAGIEISFRDLTIPISGKFTLQFHVCELANSEHFKPPLGMSSDFDGWDPSDLLLIPYLVREDDIPPHRPSLMGFLNFARNNPDYIEEEEVVIQVQLTNSQSICLAKGWEPDACVQVWISPAHWPSTAESVRQVVNISLELFVSLLDNMKS